MKMCVEVFPSRPPNIACNFVSRRGGPVSAKIPVAIDFLAMPFGEPMLFRIASAYERATRRRISPPEFGTLTA